MSDYDGIREGMHKFRSLVLERLTDCCGDVWEREACRLRKHHGPQIEKDPDYPEWPGCDPWDGPICRIDGDPIDADPSECAYHDIFDALLGVPSAPDENDG